MHRGMKLPLIVLAGGCGVNDSLDNIKQMFMKRDATKMIMQKLGKCIKHTWLRSARAQSPQRDEAALFDEDYKYY